MQLRGLRKFATVFVCLLGAAASNAGGDAARQVAAQTTGIECRAIEVHSDPVSHAMLVVFHHAADSGRLPLAAFLRDHPGATVDAEFNGGQQPPRRGTVFRLKSCFGRGLLLFSSILPIQEGSVFRLRLSELQSTTPEKNRG